jgi:hypothetical protein
MLMSQSFKILPACAVAGFLIIMLLAGSAARVCAESITWELSCEYSKPFPPISEPIFAGASITVPFFLRAHGTVKITAPSDATTILRFDNIGPNCASAAFVMDETGQYRVKETYDLAIIGVGIAQSFKGAHTWYYDNQEPGLVLFQIDDMYLDNYLFDVMPRDAVEITAEAPGRPGESVLVKLLVLRDFDIGDRVIESLSFKALWHKSSSITANGIAIRSFGPVDLLLTDPEGRMINKYESAIPAATYTEEDLNGDDELDDRIFIPDAAKGVYSVEVYPEPNAEPTRTYTLEILYADRSTTLAESVEIQDIPIEPYSFFFLPRSYVRQGRNLISLPIQPRDTVIDSVLSAMDGKYDSVWRYDPTIQGWLRYFPDAPEASDLWRMGSGAGYWIIMKEPWPLVVPGEEPGPVIPLYAGWNLVGYNSKTPKKVEDCMFSIWGKYTLVWGHDPDQGWLRHLPNTPEADSLLYMEPGNGYWIQVTENCLWDIR